jgi:hypothetical protein
MNKMTTQEYADREATLHSELHRKLYDLRMEYVHENAKFKIGDFIGNVTGIIRIQNVGYEVTNAHIEIKYSGYRYKKVNGELIRTKDSKISTLREENIKLIEHEV